jgi:hypothetical protein
VPLLCVRQQRKLSWAAAGTYPSGHLDAAAEVDVAPVVVVVDGPLLLLDVDGPGGGREDDALHGAGVLAGAHDAQHPFHRRLDHLVLHQRHTETQKNLRTQRLLSLELPCMDLFLPQGLWTRSPWAWRHGTRRCSP